MKTLTAGQLTDVLSVAAGAPYAWLFDIVHTIDYVAETGAVILATSADQEITATSPVTGASGTYQPFGASIGELSVDTTASIPALSVSVSNVFRHVSALLEQGQGFLGNRVEVQLVNGNRPADGPLLETSGYMRSVTANHEVATFVLDLYGLTQFRVPSDTMVVDRCRYRYGDIYCGFPLNLVDTGAGHDPKFLRCSKTHTACEERGDFEVAPVGPGGLGRPRRHPQRFGGFLGLPRRLRR